MEHIVIHDSLAAAIGNTPVVRLARLFDGARCDVLAKLEYLNPVGSSKDRVARYVIEHWLADGTVIPGTHLVESSSGNFGLALAALGPLYGLSVICVVDPNICRENLAILRCLGATVEMVSEPDPNGGYLGTRLARVGQIVECQPNAVWVNQYANPLCWQAHYDGIAGEILEQVDGALDVFVAAVSTTATILGTARRLRERWPAVRVVGVDACGSVIFGGTPAPRRLPGLGSSRTPEILSKAEIDEVVYVREEDAIEGCHALLRTEGILAGASSGAVVTAVAQMRGRLPVDGRVLLLLPDRGERYLDLVYGDT
jgi:2,3-diaminopropionate biosynthesis protein SbnA